jgi:hypothetical protein
MVTKMAQTVHDALIITDPRFLGGTAGAVATDMRAFSAMGLSVGLYLVRSRGFFQAGDPDNPVFDELSDLPGVMRLADGEEAAARVAFFHHPAIFSQPVENGFRVRADRSVIITHHPAFQGDGALNYDPLSIQSIIKREFCVKPDWAPISGVCRRQLESFAPFLRLTKHDWSNTFDVSNWIPKREKLVGPELTVGRHGRADAMKWADSASAISASLPAGPQTHVRIMGAQSEFFHEVGVSTVNWEILPFNGEAVPDFLDSLDVFAYFHSSCWVEAFGRTVAEAMLMGTRCVLDPNLKSNFGDLAIYCDPHEVPQIIERIRSNLPAERAEAERARQTCIARYGLDAVSRQWEALLADPGTRERTAPSVAPLRAARKLTGYHRRLRRMEAQQG